MLFLVTVCSLFLRCAGRNLQAVGPDLDRNVRAHCTPDAPCGECQGDCQHDEDCLGELVCYQKYGRANSPEAAMVPGCNGFDYSKTDWCIRPESLIGGFEDGMTLEIQGLWVGDEKYKDEDGIIYDYCSRALFHPSQFEDGTGDNFLTWHGYYIGESGETCDTIGVDIMSGDVNSQGFYTDLFDPFEGYILRVDKKICFDDCNYDILSDPYYDERYNKIASACGAHLKQDLLYEDSFSCELYQTNLLEDKATGDQTIVVILTYAMYAGGYENYVCPDKVTFDRDDFLADPNAQGMTRFVLQSSFTEDYLNTEPWECLSNM